MGMPEIVPRLLVGRISTPGSGGDVPGAAVAVGYLVRLPLMVAGCTLVGAVAWVLLHRFATHRLVEDHL